jgi:deoxyribonuclease-4
MINTNKMSIIGGCIVASDIETVKDHISNSPEMKAVQFSIDPAVVSSKCVLKDDSLGQLIKQRGIFIVEHAKYCYNFCRDNVDNQVEALIHEVNIATQLGCNVVIHQGKNVAAEKLSKIAAINNYVRHVSDVIDQTYGSDSMLLLENSAGQGTELGYTLNELIYIYNQFDETIRERIGFCIDTCHIFVAGTLDVRRKDAVVHFLEEFDTSIGIDKLKVIHFNDSGIPFGGKRDLHGDLMGGYISNSLLGGSSDGLAYMANFAKQRHIPLILETPCILHESVVGQYDIVENWANTSTKKYEVIERLSFDYYSRVGSKKSIE